MNGILGRSTVKTKRRVDGISDFVRFATTQLRLTHQEQTVKAVAYVIISMSTNETSA